MTIKKPSKRKRPPVPPPDTSNQAGVGPLNYDELPGLEDVYFEDSFVRAIDEAPTQLSFTLIAVLTPKHPFYETPKPRERHCFRPATLTFPDLRKITWHEKHDRTFTDKAGGVDHGNIDRFTAEPKGYYHLEGEWGSVDVASGPPRLEIAARETHDHLHKRLDLEAWITGAPRKAHHHSHEH